MKEELPWWSFRGPLSCRAWMIRWDPSRLRWKEEQSQVCLLHAKQAFSTDPSHTWIGKNWEKKENRNWNHVFSWWSKKKKRCKKQHFAVHWGSKKKKKKVHSATRDVTRARNHIAVLLLLLLDHLLDLLGMMRQISVEDDHKAALGVLCVQTEKKKKKKMGKWGEMIEREKKWCQRWLQWSWWVCIENNLIKGTWRECNLNRESSLLIWYWGRGHRPFRDRVSLPSVSARSCPLQTPSGVTEQPQVSHQERHHQWWWSANRKEEGSTNRVSDEKKIFGRSKIIIGACVWTKK